jgi:hypothetical protein
MFGNSMLEKMDRSEQELERFENELHLLEVETFEIEEIMDLQQSAPLAHECSCCSCSTSCMASF